MSVCAPIQTPLLRALPCRCPRQSRADGHALQPPFYAAWATPIVHDTRSGLRINAEWKVVGMGNRLAASHNTARPRCLPGLHRRTKCDGRAVSTPLGGPDRFLSKDSRRYRPSTSPNRVGRSVARNTKEFHFRWEPDLRPHGFHSAAQVLDFPRAARRDFHGRRRHICR
jgi:hypothetical protein